MQNVTNPRSRILTGISTRNCLSASCVTAGVLQTAELQSCRTTCRQCSQPPGTLQRCTTVTLLQTLWPAHEWRKCAQFILKRFNQSTYRCLLDRYYCFLGLNFTSKSLMKLNQRTPLKIYPGADGNTEI